MINRARPVHSIFESLPAAVLLPRLSVRGRPASFATNEQITALGFSRIRPHPARRQENFLECR